MSDPHLDWLTRRQLQRDPREGARAFASRHAELLEILAVLSLGIGVVSISFPVLGSLGFPLGPLGSAWSLLTYVGPTETGGALPGDPSPPWIGSDVIKNDGQVWSPSFVPGLIAFGASIVGLVVAGIASRQPGIRLTAIVGTALCGLGYLIAPTVAITWYMLYGP